MTTEFDGSTVVVTGGSRGIGAGIAKMFATEGANVVVNYHQSPEKAESVVDSIEDDGGTAVAVGADVSDPTAVDAMISEAVDSFGGVDVLVNNAGMSRIGPSVDLEISDWRRVLDIDLTGVFITARAAASEMQAQDAGGAIVNISSIMGTRGYKWRAPYAAAKAGVINLTRTLAVEWAPDDIRVNALAPGFIHTDIVKQSQAAAGYTDTDISRRTPLARYGTVDEMARCVRFLARTDTYVTGQTLCADGGWTSDAWQYDEDRA